MKSILIPFIILLVFVNTGCRQRTYENRVYGFKVKIPCDWFVYGEIKNDTVNNYSIVDWGLPKVYSDIEKTEIENAISITGYKTDKIKNLAELIDFEFDMKKDIITNKILLDSVENRAYLVYSTIRGLNYKSKMYFVYRNGIGYVIIFTATEGTFDKNIMKFEAFFKRIKFVET